MVEEQDLDLPPVVGINNTGARVDEMFAGEARARSDTAIWEEEGGLMLAKHCQNYEDEA